ncbi:related to cytochrome P450 CYP3/CYP5/CYP6/CYP9 subfamilies [Phialocephala subalpina]|uniref:Related to cytochrome P450 CYP3/CYP5/CYP6/CYP9 subfamilies n=1 Tax=Phialocephala subalpina TaxID=576137 RepID=A0A1L7WIJ5_9HELO|nr:related to cytochrome P450 CYP3/CYP5/CYP6/CYP9 subfamilies [Phialocephala subalpina]
MGLLSEFTAQAVPTLVALGIFYAIAFPIYRVYFSPLSKFPGPKLAAATLWYEFYYDVILNGQYEFKIQELHKQYGPIIRISPFELHINDPEYYDVLYSNNLPVNKSSWYTRQFDMGHATFGTIEHKQHRLRRSALNPFFSKQMISKLEPTIQAVVEKLFSRLEEFRGAGKPVEMRAAYSALTIDVITAYAFNESWEHLDSPDFKKDWFDGVHLMMGAGNFMKQFPWLFSVVRVLPQSVVVWLSPTFENIFMYENRIKAQTERVIAGASEPGKGDSGIGLDKTIMHALLQSDLPPEERTAKRLWSEGLSVVGAGSETSANTLAVMHFHLLDNPNMLTKLRAELKEALPDGNAPIKLNVVERLPYLTAVITEGLRLSSGVSSRLGRNLPGSSMRYKDFVIPAGTSVGMTPYLLNLDPNIFPEPTKFSPERWLDKSTSKQLDKYMVAFSRGTRICLGINLAKAELYLTVATIFRRFDTMKLFETTKRDVTPIYDHFIPHPALDSKGVRVLYG